MGKSTTIAVDLAKSVFAVAVSDRPGRVGERQRLNRPALLPYFAQREPATVLLEACGTAHFWARELDGLGHRVRLLPAQRVRRYRQGNKTDRADAWLPARGFHPGPEPVGLQREAVDTTAVLPFVKNRAARYLREESRYDGLAGKCIPKDHRAEAEKPAN